MGLKEQTYLTSYNKAEHDIADMFYLPCMRHSSHYDRISGYFGSTIYIIAWDALRQFIENGGKMRLICSPYVSDEDATALANGYSAKNDELLAESLAKEVQVLFDDPFLTAPAKLLAYMISKGIIDVKIAVPTGNESPNARRLFHDKVGIFSDAEGSKVGFRGSMNETYKGLSSDGNKLSVQYEEEQKQVRQVIGELQSLIDSGEQGAHDLQQFLKSVRKYTDPEELTAEMLNELVDKIIVHAPDKSSGHRKQKIEIYYKAAGIIDVADDLCEAGDGRGQWRKERKTA